MKELTEIFWEEKCLELCPLQIYTAEDFFQLFPEEIRPWDCMLLWGTAHSRSLLHIDPYNWTGTNAVLWGTKKWKVWPCPCTILEDKQLFMLASSVNCHIRFSA